MSAQGRVVGPVMRAYCQRKPAVLPALRQAHKAVKNGEMKKLWSISRFWKWFRKKKNILLVGMMAAMPAIAFIDSLIVMLLVWFLVAFGIYLIKNSKSGEGNE